MKNKIKKFLVKRTESPWLFFGVTFTLTWIFWLPAALLGEINNSSVMVLIFLGGVAGKIIPPTVIPYITYGKKSWRDYWQRLIDFKRIGFKWWGVTLLLPVLFTGLGIFTAYLLGYELPTFTMKNL